MSINVLFVCLGNICRSPTAQGIFESRVARAGFADEFFVDSAGTASFHIGKAPDSRAILAAERNGYSIKDQRARQIQRTDFEKFHYIIGMDRMNEGNIKALAPKDYAGEIHLFMEFSGRGGIKQVPDPYKETQEAFDKNIILLETAADGLLNHIIQSRQLSS